MRTICLSLKTHKQTKKKKNNNNNNNYNKSSKVIQYIYTISITRPSPSPSESLLQSLGINMKIIVSLPHQQHYYLQHKNIIVAKQIHCSNTCDTHSFTWLFGYLLFSWVADRAIDRLTDGLTGSQAARHKKFKINKESTPKTEI